MRLESGLSSTGTRETMSICCDGESSKQFIYFQKCMYVSIMHAILTEMQDSFFSVDYRGM
jgi:hypothetical protein